MSQNSGGGGSSSNAMDLATLSVPDTTKLASSTASCTQRLTPEGSPPTPGLSLQAPTASATVHIQAPFKAGQADKHSDILADLSPSTELQEKVLPVSLAEDMLIDTASLHHILPGLADWAAQFALLEMTLDQ